MQEIGLWDLYTLEKASVNAKQELTKILKLTLHKISAVECGYHQSFSRQVVIKFTNTNLDRKNFTICTK